LIQQVFALTQYNGAIVGPIARILAYIMNGIYSVFSAFKYQLFFLGLV